MKVYKEKSRGGGGGGGLKKKKKKLRYFLFGLTFYVPVNNKTFDIRRLKRRKRLVVNLKKQLSIYGGEYREKVWE